MASKTSRVNPIIFDRPLLRARRQRAERRGASDFLIERVADEMAERLSVVLRQFDLAVDLGTPGEAVRRALAASGKVGTIVAANPLATRASAGALAVVADEEALPFRDGALDLVVSALSLQFANDLPGALVQIRRALRADGLLLAALLGGDTLTELRQAFAEAEAEMEDGIRRGWRRSPTCASSAPCCSATALRCRSPTSTASACVTRHRSR